MFWRPKLEEEKKISPPLATTQPMRHYHNSANEKSLHFKLPVSCNGHFIYHSPSQLILLLYKRFSSLQQFYLDLLVVHHSCVSLVANLKLLFFNKPVLLVKITRWVFCLFVCFGLASPTVLVISIIYFNYRVCS